jgi:RNA polymerase sigma factor (sigma-70 family)
VAFLEDVLRRMRPELERPGAEPGDLERVALEYVGEKAAARKLVHDAAELVLGVSREPRSAREARARVVRGIRNAGSMDVFRRAYERYFDRWCRYVMHIVPGDLAFAEDVVQEVVAATLSAHPDFKDHKPVNAYVRRSIRRLIGKLLGSARLEVSIDVEDAMRFDLPHAGPSPQRTAMRTERALRLRKALRESPPEEREAYLLHRLAKKPWKLKAIAEKQKVSPRTISERIRRVRARLLAVLEE